MLFDQIKRKRCTLMIIPGRWVNSIIHGNRMGYVETVSLPVAHYGGLFIGKTHHAIVERHIAKSY